MPEVWTRAESDLRARALLARGNQVRPQGEASFVVKSQSRPGVLYSVTIGTEPSCTCDHYQTIGPCVHVAAVRYFIETRHQTPLGPFTERVPVTAAAASAMYDAAQTAEGELFGELLRALLAEVPEPPHENGRPPVPLRDQIFCAASKVQSTMSARRAHSIFREAAGKEQITRAPHYIISSRLMNREDVTPILHDLIARSALPLVGLESHFALDSTGFRSTSFGSYLSEKHGVRRENEWVKAHFLIGTKSHIIVGARVTGPSGADSPQLPVLVAEAAARGFRIEALSADAAYSGRANHEAVAAIGGTAYIPFKSNATGRTGGSPAWHKAFHLFQAHRDQFDAKYHVRSNVESVNSALKRKYGEVLRSKNPTARTNELLLKALCYNIGCVIRAMFEHGINPDFLKHNPPAQNQTPGREEV